MADGVGQLANTEFNSCLWWDLRNGSETGNNNSSSLYGWRPFGDYGVLASGDRGDTPVNTPYPAFYAAKLLAHWGRGGDQVVSAASNYAWLSCYAAKLASGSLALLVINKHSTSNLTAQVTLTGFTPGTNTAASYSYGKTNDLANSDLTTGSFNPGAGTFSHTFPSYSMTVLVIPAAQTAAVPNLLIVTNGANSVKVLWPNTGSYTLQQNSNLAAKAGWTTSGYSITTNANGTNSVTITPSTGTLFFRLANP
jgi:hypothetical protein